jgi:hypothetical protein
VVFTTRVVFFITIVGFTAFAVFFGFVGVAKLGPGSFGTARAGRRKYAMVLSPLSLEVSSVVRRQRHGHRRPALRGLGFILCRLVVVVADRRTQKKDERWDKTK